MRAEGMLFKPSVLLLLVEYCGAECALEYMLIIKHVLMYSAE